MKSLVIFIPSIESGGVEKNLFYISNYIQNKFDNIYLVSSDQVNKRLFGKKIKIISPRMSWIKFESRFFKSLICFFLLLKNFFNKKIVILSFQSNFFAIIASKIINSRIIIRLNTSTKKYLNNIFKKFFFKVLYNSSDKIIVNSNEFKKEIKNEFNLDATVILNPIKLYKIKKKKISFFNKFKGLKILSIGRLTDQKDQITLLKASKILKEKYSINFKIYLIGQGTYKDSLKKFILLNNLSKNVKIAGYKKNAFAYLKSSDLFILTSKYEGLPNVLIEAQSLGIPVISSNCPTGPKEILKAGKLGDLFNVGDFSSLSKKIYNFYRNKKILRRKAILAKNFLDYYDYETNLKKYVKIIQKQIN